MDNYLPVFRSQYGEKQVFEAYDAILKSWPVAYEDIYVPTCLGSTHIIMSGPVEAPPVILIHAFYASAVAWYRNVESLSAKFRVYCVDIAGDPNKSNPVKLIRKLSDFVDWFNDLMNGLNLTQADFIGNSVGAFHILNYALNEPERVKKMILIGPAASFINIPAFYKHTFPGGMTGYPLLVRHAVRWVENGVPLEPDFHRLFYLLMRYGKSANQVFPKVFSDEELKRIVSPTLLIFGEKEVIYDYKLAISRAEQNMQNIISEIIPGANHLTAASVPGLTNNAILKFLGTGL